MHIIQGDITTFNPESRPSAIVNAANTTLLGGGGVDGAIHRAAGPELKAECLKLPEIPGLAKGVRCMTGDAKLTPAGNLGVDYVIHAVGPIWPRSNARSPRFPGERFSEPEQARKELACCINTCFSHASNKGVKSIAFPAISCGVFGGRIKVFAEVLWETLQALNSDGHTLPKVTVYLFQMEELEEFVRVARTFVPWAGYEAQK